MFVCEICREETSFRWSDNHGVAACSRCGLPYRLYHYGDDGKRTDAPPSVAVKAEWMPLAAKYWAETGKRVFPAAYDMGFSGRTSYSGATPEDVAAWSRWLKAHQSEWPEQTEAA